MYKYNVFSIFIKKNQGPFYFSPLINLTTDYFLRGFFVVVLEEQTKSSVIGAGCFVLL